jgi:hypothetical protein
VPTVETILLATEFPVHVFGKVHVYDVAPLTGAMANVSAPPVHALPAWEIEPGVVGAEESTVIVNVWANELPHALLAVTEMLPPDVPAVVVILAVVDISVHPPGSVHV